MADVHTITTTNDTFTYVKNGKTLGTWDKIPESEIETNEWEFDVDDNQININLSNPYLGEVILPSHTITVDSVDKSALTMRQLWAFLKTNVFFTEASSGTPTEVVVYQLKTTLTDAEIKALPTTGIHLVEAPGAGKQILVHRAFCRTKFTGSYTTDPLASWVLMIGNQYMSSFILLSSIMQTTTQYGVSFPIPYAYQQVVGDFSGEITTQADGPISDLENKPLKIKDDKMGVADYTGGHASNTLEITVNYSIVDL